MMRRWSDDRGNISVLTLGMLVLTMVLVLTVSAATHVHMQRTRLMHLADESALAAADALDVSAYYQGSTERPSDDAGVTVSDARMLEAVREHVETENARLGDSRVQVVRVRTVDQHTVEVTLRAVVQPLFGLEVLAPFAGGIDIVVTSGARAY